jgi:hypothetical protein
VSRNEHFEAGLADRDPRSLHPNMHDYPAQIGNVSGEESTVGYVRTDLLAGMHGNGTDREGIERHKARLLSGEGFTDPAMVEFDPGKKIARVGEGNHRVEAARELGVSHVPVRVVRSRFDAEYTAQQGGRARPVEATSPWRGGTREYPEEYWPPTMHPKYLFPKDVLA